jgi:hypothetical protein
MVRLILLFLWCSVEVVLAQQTTPHQNAHAHNDYKHARPLWDALDNGFISVEADIHAVKQRLLVSHNKPGRKARTLEELYLKPLDSLLAINNGWVYPNVQETFYLMIDFKTHPEKTYPMLKNLLSRYPNLLCSPSSCPVKIYITGRRPMEKLLSEGYIGIALDGRPNDLGKGYTVELMPVVSERYSRLTSHRGRVTPRADDLDQIRGLANRVHAEGKKLRLWAIPDNENSWGALLEAGVDLINTDKLQQLHVYLRERGL